jgi:PAS domain S-box-containing protein
MTHNFNEEYVINPNIAWELMDAFGDDIFILDQTGRILSINGPACIKNKRKSEEIIGSQIKDLFVETNLQNFQIVFNQVVETGKSITYVMKQKDRWLKVLIYPVFKKGDSHKTVAICNRDITSQINAEEKLKRTVFKLVTTQENERYRISRDLHDEVGQRMTGLIFELRTLKESIIKEQIISINVIDNLIRNFETVLKHIRQIFYQLHPPSLDKVELPLVLEAFCSTFEETNQIKVDFSCQQEFPSLPEAYAIAIYRFIQEGLTNIAKHSHALSAWISLDYSDNEISIFMEDNGQGFDTKTSREGLGLQGIRERFFPLDGSIEIESTIGKGTQLSGILPFKANRGRGIYDSSNGR